MVAIPPATYCPLWTSAAVVPAGSAVPHSPPFDHSMPREPIANWATPLFRFDGGVEPIPAGLLASNEGDPLSGVRLSVPTFVTDRRGCQVIAPVPARTEYSPKQPAPTVSAYDPNWMIAAGDAVASRFQLVPS